MAWIDDITVVNNAATAGNWSIVSGYDSPTLNDSSATTPIYIEGSACMWWPLKKGVTNGYVGTATISGTPSMTGRILVGFINYPFADISAIPISSLFMRMSSSTGFTTNYAQWDCRAQILAPENVPISGHTPIIGYPDAATETGTPNYGTVESVGWVGTTGETADGKQGGFDWFYIVSWIGAHSATLSGTLFSGLYSEYFDNEGSSLPGQTSRPIAVFSRAGDFYQSNVRIQLGDGTSDTANIDVTETSKTVFFNNLHVNHELGYLFVNPASTHEIRLTLTDCVHLWNDQASTNEIFDGIANVDYFKLDGCSFSRGGKVSLPADTANRWVRGCKFDDCQAGTISDGEFTDNIVSNGEAFTVSGDADLTGTQFLTPVVAANASALIWNGNFDPDGNLDNMTFSKGTNAHHAIEFGTASPTSLTLRNITFTGFSASNNVNDSTLHIKRTTGTVTINIIGGTTPSYRTDGATVVIQNTVTVKVTAKDADTLSAIENARVLLEADSVATGTHTGTNNASTLTDSSKSFTTNELVGYRIYNTTDGSDGSITANTATTVTATLAGGTENDWDTSDAYIIVAQPALNPVSITRSVSTATVTHRNHGLATGASVIIRGATQDEYNGIFTITVTGANAYTYTVSGTPATPATGSPTSTAVVLSGLTNASGIIQTTSFNFTIDQPITGKTRKATTGTKYKTGAITGTITNAGFDTTILLIPDE